MVIRVEWDLVKFDMLKDLNIVKSGLCVNSVIIILRYIEFILFYYFIKLMMKYIMRNVCFNNFLKMFCKISRLYIFDLKCVFVL